MQFVLIGNTGACVTVNTDKTKFVIFSRGKIRTHPEFKLSQISWKLFLNTTTWEYYDGK